MTCCDDLHRARPSMFTGAFIFRTVFRRSMRGQAARRTFGSAAGRACSACWWIRGWM